MTKAQIESTYGVKVRDDSYYNVRLGKVTKQYKIYSADGCKWENGLKTMKAVELECRRWEKELLSIKERRG